MTAPAPSDDGPVRPDGPAPGLERFSFNQATAQHWPLQAAVAGCAAAGVPGIGLWREPVQEYGLDRAARLVRAAGLTVTSLCRGGFFTTPDWWDENRRAIEEAATLGTRELVLVSGGLPPGSRDVDGARRQVADAVAALADEATAAGVRLAIEPLHPMFSADRCVIATLGQALDIAERFDPAVVGVVVDTYHVWWDDTVYAQIARAGDRIAAFQAADWVTPLPEGALLGRALPGEGCVELRRLREAVDAAGYTGPVEVEVFQAALWSRPGPDILAATIDAYRGHVS
ncbi:sugar phosphate isomerase/epimerase family protein [Micromonospora humida]|uniref:sugar phosphate isomerase/epimerase family protein n=1 Tax=Micromonospora humida TaxID=2809018 RepID=UPI003F4D8F78